MGELGYWVRLKESRGVGGLGGGAHLELEKVCRWEQVGPDGDSLTDFHEGWTLGVLESRKSWPAHTSNFAVKPEDLFPAARGRFFQYAVRAGTSNVLGISSSLPVGKRGG
eukprot:9472116-Pyramimonas_sp.AAC.1